MYIWSVQSVDAADRTEHNASNRSVTQCVCVCVCVCVCLCVLCAFVCSCVCVSM